MRYLPLVFLAACATGVISDPEPPEQSDCIQDEILSHVRTIARDDDCVFVTPTEIACPPQWQAGLSDATHAVVRNVAHYPVRDVCFIRVHSCSVGGTEVYCDPTYVWEP